VKGNDHGYEDRRGGTRLGVQRLQERQSLLRQRALLLPEVRGAVGPVNWRKSSFSFSNGNCIEVAEAEAADWRKASQSESGNCVEVASGVAVRDTQDREGPVLTFSAAAWRAFTAALGLDTRNDGMYASERTQ
jgi:hypothetical protein